MHIAAMVKGYAGQQTSCVLLWLKQFTLYLSKSYKYFKIVIEVCAWIKRETYFTTLTPSILGKYLK